MQKSIMIPITPTVFENGVLKKSGISQHFEPKTNWNGKGVKWYEDKRKEQ